MCQGDSIYDLVDTRDHSAVQAELSSGPPTISTPNSFPDERVFICRMNLSRTAKRHIQYYKFILVEGRYLHPIEYYQTLNSIPNPTAPIQPIFAAFCRPLINPENAETLSTGNTSMFRSIHFLDMKFLHLDEIGECYLGFNQLQIDGLSFYQLLHPLNVQQFSAKHKMLCQQKEGSAIALLRLQTRNGEFIWLHSVFVIKGNIIQSQPSSSSASSTSSSQESSPRRVRHLIHATYQVLTELEAATLQANEWIYAIKQHHFSREFSKEDFGESVSPDSSESDFNTGGEYTNEAAASQICVEIPLKHSTVNFPLQRSHHSLMTPEQHSSPDSNSSLSTAATKSFCLDSLPHFYPHEVSNMPLPELGDDLDEFFRQVENSPPPATAPQQPRGIKREWKLGDDLDEFFRQVENSPPPATAPRQPRGIKREWNEMSTGWNSSEHTDPLLYAEPPVSQYKPQRHHSIQFGHHSELLTQK
uniref:PAS domain-containing protein n=1 Tax=Panagrolaimus sp. PS1159 TaxID=55785 RepID=A0AC35GGH1_9BILA